jgi:hypothetical protein
MSGAVRTARPDSMWRVVVLPGALACGAAIAVAVLTVNFPEGLRVLLAVALATNIGVVAVRWPRLAVYLALMFLPFLALTRRLLIEEAPWTSYDPLLLVGPVAALLLLYRWTVRARRPLAKDALSTLVLALLAVVVLETVNPYNPSPVAGVTGLLFVGVPLIWFFVGREIADRALVSALVYSVIVIAIAIGIYGWYQTERALPSWDAKWVDIAGYAALSVGDKIRAFGTLSSSAEYAELLGVACAFGLALALHKRMLPLVALPLVVVPLFLASVRGVMVFTLFAIIVMCALRSRKALVAVLATAVGIAATLGFLTLAKPALLSLANASGNALITHQVEGLVNPFDPHTSTLQTHWNLVVHGMQSSVRNPIGQGTGSINIAAQTSGSPDVESTEVDLSNAFIGLGVIGGVLFLAIVVLTLRQVMSRYIRHGDPLVLAVVGLLIVLAGDWLNGGEYAVASLTWFLLGWGTRSDDEQRGDDSVESRPAEP